MSTNKIDKQIADKLKNRELSPSSSAWERLNSQLDEHQNQKKRNWFLYVGYAASLALLLSVGFSFFLNSDTEKSIETIVETSIDTLKMNDVKMKELINDTEEAIVQVEEKKEEILPKKVNQIPIIDDKTEVVISQSKEELEFKPIQEKSLPKEIVIASVDKTSSIEVKKNDNSRIKVNSDDLLFAVTHNSEEIKEYYARHKVKREDVLKTIEDELKRSDFKINPNTILAEVERTIDDEEYNGDFMQKLKLKISDIAVAIVDRNK
ncbi:hypothetical protein C8N26_1419 [Tenacibaculum lutimaris]|uniref:Uncharacterized protein n=1 Tax=Tenacibaculum lutimaris TaxID=285258 RepID=A0A420E0Z4_9FLAO|nr:hypothetical protein [Tenacibaculum lutimaris]RKF03791.1 hypothetical protein C8N26_1419 [Tenacibaculum lutimaris]